MSSVNEVYPTPVFSLMGAALTVVKRELEAEVASERRKLRGSHLRLLSLVPRAGIRPSELAVRVGMTKQSLGEFVAALEEAGYVQVSVDPTDRRARIVTPTAKGIRLQRKLERILVDFEDRWREEVGDSQWDTFLKVLSHLAAPLQSTPSQRSAHH